MPNWAVAASTSVLHLSLQAAMEATNQHFRKQGHPSQPSSLMTNSPRLIASWEVHRASRHRVPADAVAPSSNSRTTTVVVRTFEANSPGIRRKEKTLKSLDSSSARRTQSLVLPLALMAACTPRIHQTLPHTSKAQILESSPTSLLRITLPAKFKLSKLML